jgi:hypothetical protein
MTDREREFARLGLEYAEGIEACQAFQVPATGRLVRKTAHGTWAAQPWDDVCWLEFSDPLLALAAATPPAGVSG